MQLGFDCAMPSDTYHYSSMIRGIIEL